MIKKLSRVTQQLDVFGTDIGFNYNNSNIFRTNFGSFISVLFLTSMLIFFWNNVSYHQQKKFIIKQSTSSLIRVHSYYFCFFNFIISVTFLLIQNYIAEVNFVQQQQFNINPEEIQFDSNNFMFGVQISQTTSFIKTPYFNITLTYTIATKLTNGTIDKQKIPVVLEPCTIDHWIQFKPIIPDIESSFTANTLNDYLCPRKNDTFKIQGQYLNDLFEYLKFGVVSCKNKTFTDSDQWKYSCLSFSEQQKILKSENIRFRMMYPNYIVNPGNPKDILTGFLDMLYFSIQPGAMYTTADIYFTNHYVETDQSLLPFEEIEEKKYIVFTMNNYRLQTLVGNYTTMAEFYIRSDFFSIQTTRTFTKVDEFISYIGGFAQVFLLASALLVSVYNDLQYSVKLANKLYDFDFSNSKKQKTPKKKKDLPQVSSSKYILSPRNNDNKDQQSDTQIMGQSPFSHDNMVDRNNDEKNKFEEELKQNRGNTLNQIKTDMKQLDKKKGLPSVQFQNQSISQNQQLLYQDQSPTSDYSKQFFSTSKIRGEVGMVSIAESRCQQSMLDELQSPTDSYRQQLNQNYNPSKGFDDYSPVKTIQQAINLNQASSNNNQQKLTNSTQFSQKLINLSNIKQDEQNSIGSNTNTNRQNKAKNLNKQISQFGQNNENQKSTLFSPRDKTASSIPRILFQDKKQFLEQEIKEILNRAKKIKITFKYFLFKLTCKKMFADEQNQLIEKACDRVEEDLDILVLLNRLKDVEKIKELMFDKQQQLLFNFFPKPVIKIQDIDEDVIDQKSLKKEAKNQPKKKFKNDLQINIRMIGIIMKAVQKFKAPLIKKITSFDNVDAYQRLYEAFEYVSYKNPNSLMNQKLVNLLGDELRHVFETCRLIEVKQEKMSQQLYDGHKSNKTFNDIGDNGNGTPLHSPSEYQFCSNKDSNVFQLNSLKKNISKIDSPLYSPNQGPLIGNIDEILSSDDSQDKDLDLNNIEQTYKRAASQKVKNQQVRMITNIKEDINNSMQLKSNEIDIEMNQFKVNKNESESQSEQ